MDHTPQTPADDRALRLLEHSTLPADKKEALLRLVKRAQADAAQTGDELLAEFGKEHVALIAGHNQFVRLFRAGTEPGAVELWLDVPAKAALGAAGFTLKDPEGQVFKLFGWTRVDPAQGDASALDEALGAAFARARAPKKR